MIFFWLLSYSLLKTLFYLLHFVVLLFGFLCNVLCLIIYKIINNVQLFFALYIPLIYAMRPTVRATNCPCDQLSCDQLSARNCPATKCPATNCPDPKFLPIKTILFMYLFMNSTKLECGSKEVTDRQKSFLLIYRIHIVDNGRNDRVEMLILIANSSIAVMDVKYSCYGLFVDINNNLYCFIGKFQ